MPEMINNRLGDFGTAIACASKDGVDYDLIKELQTTKNNHPMRDMIKAMDTNIGVDIVSKNIKNGKCGIVWRLTFNRDFYFGKKTMKKGTTFDLEINVKLFGDKWLIWDI